MLKGEKAMMNTTKKFFNISKKVNKRLSSTGQGPEKKQVVLNINQTWAREEFFFSNITRKIQSSSTGAMFSLDYWLTATINIKVMTLGPGNIVGSRIRARWGPDRMKCVYRKHRTQRE